MKRQAYKAYSPSKLTDAYFHVHDQGSTVAKAARKFSIPEQTPRDRILGHVSVDNVKSGPPPVFNLDQEANLVDHIKYMASVGYGYTRAALGLGFRK